MEGRAAPIRAAIDVGSNTIHVVVARCSPDTLEILADELDLTRIGQSVTATGEISPEKCADATRIIKHYQGMAQEYGAEQIFVVATEAIRQARNRDAFIAQIKKETGLETQLVSGSEEAALTFLGASYEAGPREHLGVLDLGGGSMELVFARNMHITWRTSISVGSGWLHDRYLPGDPPTAREIEVAETFLQTYFRGLPVKQTPSVLIATGGSANSLLFLARNAFHLEDTHSLSLATLERCQSLLCALEAQDIATLYNQHASRATLLLAGTLIIKQVMRRFHRTEILVSPHGIREGVLLASARFGECWLEKVGQEEQHEQNTQNEETFAHTAHTMLLKRLHSMLDCLEGVLKHEDVEAVHKMRVASRRLRATLDAYQSCCEPALFQKIYRQVKKIADGLGEARDADVLLQFLYKQLDTSGAEEQAGISWLITALKTYRQQMQKNLEVTLHHLDGEQLAEQLKACLREGSER